MESLVFRGVVKRFGRRTVLAGLDFELRPGAVTVLLGRNGAGKSTLMRLAVGLLAADAGSVLLGDVDVRTRAGARRRAAIGFVPDRPDVWPWMTPAELFRFLAAHHEGFDRRRAAELAERLSLPLDRPFRHLSRGEATKVMVSAALAPDPGIVLLDEPFGGLDPLVRDEVVAGVLGELAGGGRNVLVSTHDLETAARVADRVAVLDGGRIAREGPIEELTEERQAPAAALRDALALAGVRS